MKVLLVCTEKSGTIAPFVKEQADNISKLGTEIGFFTIKERGVRGYLNHLRAFRHTVSDFRPDIIHAHYGLCGVFANTQRKYPVITTYHGSDINNSRIRKISRIAIYLSRYNIFVSEAQATLVKKGENYSLLACGVDMTKFKPLDKLKARMDMGLSPEKKYILFSSSFDNEVKNYKLAESAVKLLKSDVEILELKGYSREEVNLLMNACDVALLTSESEGSPQFIKEAMACNLPIVSVDVGDVKEIVNKTDGCYICNENSTVLADKLRLGLNFGKRTKGRERLRVLGLDSESVARKLILIYKEFAESDLDWTMKNMYGKDGHF